ncbi:uncharacterized protein HD556DRAFT_1305219 [Suillus plorans]|uniref:Uncharacterized protein n=1 Tax=Suillus plorans TaxID=116603 RepID=A0A9P7J2W7_9AGAM|nr:uncharacterized protein HD556DRAFT_1305219 [Suillus plorans]KAG1800479.1 hypothetical protein HD556DRAFT_1305219 [Suillus plorans]
MRAGEGSGSHSLPCILSSNIDHNILGRMPRTHKSKCTQSKRPTPITQFKHPDRDHVARGWGPHRYTSITINGIEGAPVGIRTGIPWGVGDLTRTRTRQKPIPALTGTGFRRVQQAQTRTRTRAGFTRGYHSTYVQHMSANADMTRTYVDGTRRRSGGTVEDGGVGIVDGGIGVVDGGIGVKAGASGI